MKIRKAKIEDADTIKRIVEDSTISRGSKEKIGFFEYKNPSKEEYVKRIENNPFFYVVEESGKVIGLSSAYSEEMIGRFPFLENRISSYLLNNFNRFIYWELIGVDREYRNKNISKKLIKHLIEEAKKSNYKIISGPIVHQPHKNKVSIELLNKFGFELIKEIKENDLVFGIYKKEL